MMQILTEGETGQGRTLNQILRSALARSRLKRVQSKIFNDPLNQIVTTECENVIISIRKQVIFSSYVVSIQYK